MRLIGNPQDRWVEELIKLCNDNSFMLSDGSRLTIFTAAQDLNGWLNDRRQYDGQHKLAWKSSIDDLEAAYEVLGSNAKTFIDPYLASLRIPLNHLPADLPQDKFAHRAKAVTQHNALLNAIQTPGFLTATWKDLVDSCQDENLETNSLRLRRDNLWCIANHLGHDMQTLGLGSQIADVLADHAMSIAFTKAGLGDRDYPEYGEIDPEESAGLTLQDRLDICERLLLANPPVAHNVVWLYLQNASLPSPKLECGGGVVTLFNTEWLKRNLLDDGPSKHELPVELISGEAHMSKYDFPTEPYIVMARLDLGNGIVSSALRRATDIMSALLTLADSDMRSWKISSGYITFRNGERASQALLNLSTRREQYTPTNDYTPYMIKELESELQVVASAATTPMLRDALDARRWLKEVENAEPLSKLVVSVRVLELIASWTTNSNKDWYKFAKEFQQDEWCQDFLIKQLEGACISALHAGSEFPQVVEEELGAMAGDVIKHGKGSSFQFHRDRSLVHLSRLINIHKDKPRVRMLKELSRHFASGTDIANQLNVLRQDFIRLLNRLRRYRNSAQHGGIIINEAVSGIDNFAHTLAILGTLHTLRALLDGDVLLAAAIGVMNDAQQRYSDLYSGSSSIRLFT